MDGQELFDEIKKSPKLQELIETRIDETSSMENREINVINAIIEGQIRHSSDDLIFKNILKLFDL